ncbi:MAG: carbamoyltransferase [Myxococcales bacterium]|nr:carbamoyltransferase [Myxococcales bacterium]
MIVLGVSAFYHESTCCLLRDGALVAAVPEERFTRVKYDRRAPINAFRYCLEAAGGLSPAEIDCVAYYESPQKKLARQLSMGLDASVDPHFAWLDPGHPERALRAAFGYDGLFVGFEHHQSHAASTYFFSGFAEAAVLTVDGVGEWATTTYGHGRGAELKLLEEVVFPDSLGLLYSAITDYLGFSVLSDEYKVMGLAPYGRPRFVEAIGRLVRPGARGQFALDPAYFDFARPDRMYTDALPALFGVPPRAPESAIERVHEDIAHSLQVVLEEVLLAKVRHLHDLTQSENLCLAGGVALNCVANGRIRREGPFADLFVQPAAGDSGGALGAAALAHIELTGERPAGDRLPHVYLGPSASPGSIAVLLEEAGIAAIDHRGDEDALLDAVVDRLVAGKVIGWFHGRMEFGPRALGARSILADPRDPEMRERLNALVKKREGFRPFAPAILEAQTAAHLDLRPPSRFMSETCQVRSPLDLPAITHVDGSARAQTVDPETAPRFARLIERFFARTGCPLLVNTSFNVRGEPIVCTPADALRCMANSRIDCLALEDFIVDAERIPAFLRHRAKLGAAAVRDRVETQIHPRLSGNAERWQPAEGALPRGVYTFV